MTRFQILTTFPEMFQGPVSESMLRKAQEAELVDIQVHNLRDWTRDRHRSTDDLQYGGGEGMVMLAEPIIDSSSTRRIKRSTQCGSKRASVFSRRTQAPPARAMP